MLTGIIWILLSLHVSISNVFGGNVVSKSNLNTLANSIGDSLFNFGLKATRFNELNQRFELGNFSVVPINLEDLYNEIVLEINKTLSERVKAIEKTVFDAEQQAFNYYNKINPEPEPKSYYSSKRLLDESKATEAEKKKQEGWQFPFLLTLTKDDHFQADVNTSVSSVHIPTSIYELEDKVIEALTWSSDLDARFRSNYLENPALGFQYFGSSTGFLRHFPAMKWQKGLSPDDPDLYDCRVRPWYTVAATSPKNLLILQDVSGSMTGLRSEISERVVLTILETLTSNDYVNVFNFSEWPEPLVSCFNNTLVQANLENIREFKVALGQALTKSVANYTRAFDKAFSVLEQNFDGESSSKCNQAIMLITDGSPEYFQEIFDTYNKDKEVRLFTYLIGKEVTDWKEVLWMSCYNKGYFSHVETKGQVQEQVVKYLPVMSRPLVLHRDHARHVTYTPVYADNSEIEESDWQWEERIRKEQRKRSERYKWFLNNVHKKGSNVSLAMEFSDQIRENVKGVSFSEERIRDYIEYGKSNISEKMKRRVKAEEERINLKLRHLDKVDGPKASPITFKQVEMNTRHAKVTQYRWGPYEKQYKFLVSVSLPVLDLRTTAFDNITQKEERIANFLGVVGTDISLNELVKLTSPFKLGVNSYAFMITNNGYIVFHPDWRPTHDGILKPNYNTVDMFEVELVDKDNIRRNNDRELLRMRQSMIESTTNNSSRMALDVRIHRDGFSRVHTRRQEYVYGLLNKTPYTLVLTAPVGSNRFLGEIEIMRHIKDKKENVVEFFDAIKSYDNNKYPKVKYVRRWGLNPDWKYCEFLGGARTSTGLLINNKEDLLLYFLKKIQGTSWTNSSTAWKNTGLKGDDQETYSCDKSLVQSVVFDAQVTSIFKSESAEQEFRKLQGELRTAALMAFVATRSGLTRWVDFVPKEFSSTDIPFTKHFPRATDEIWYKRAVEWHEIDENAFVYSVPFDAGTRNSTPITATRALFITKRGRKAPAAVVGIQFDHAKLFNILMESSSYELRGGQQHLNVCQSYHFECFLLDDSGFIIYSETRDDNGRFMGDVDSPLMEILLNFGVYKSISITDFQGICKQNVIHSNFGTVLFSPFKLLKLMLNWFLSRLAWLVLQFNLHSFINPDYGVSLAEYADGGDRGGGGGGAGDDETMLYIAVATIPKTKLRPCDMKYELFTYGPWYHRKNETHLHNKRPLDICDETCTDYINVQRIPKSNLILVVVEAKCRCDNPLGQPISIKGHEIKYEMYQDFINLTDENPVLEELCLIRQPPLHRKAPDQCFNSHAEESLLREDCGGAMPSINSSPFYLLVICIIPTIFHI